MINLLRLFITIQTAVSFLPFSNGGVVDLWESDENGHVEQIRREDNETIFQIHNNHQYEAKINDLLSRYQDGTSSNPFFMFLAMQLPHTPFDGDNVEESFRKLYADGSAFLDDKYKDLTTYDEDSESAKTSHIGVGKLIICRFKIFTPTSFKTEYILKSIF